MPIIIVITALILVLLLIYRLNKAKFNQVLSYLAIAIGIGSITFLIVSGRLPWIIGVIGAGLALLERASKFFKFAGWLRRYQRQKSTPGSAQLYSNHLRLHIQHHDGYMHGEITAGPHRGRSLAQLSFAELIELHQLYLQRDQEAAALLASYLRQTYSQWQNPQERTTPPTPQEKLSREEALAILGLSEPVDIAQIIQTHRQLIQKLHPDRGGSDWLASRLNAAKERLLQKKN